MKKKLISLVLALVLLAALGIPAMAAGENTMTVNEDSCTFDITLGKKPVRFEGKLDLPAGAKSVCIHTRYGFLEIRHDGTYAYTPDTSMARVQRAEKEKKPICDNFVITYRGEKGGWKGQELKLVIVPEGADGSAYRADRHVNGINTTKEGTYTTERDGEVVEAGFRNSTGRFCFDQDGSFVFTFYDFLEPVRDLKKGETYKEYRTLSILKDNGEVEDITLKFIVHGADEKSETPPKEQYSGPTK